MKNAKGGGSASKVDLLKSALEINHKSSNPVLGKTDKISNQSLDARSDSAPKLNVNHSKNISYPALSVVVDEVSRKLFVFINI